MYKFLSDVYFLDYRRLLVWAASLFLAVGCSGSYSKNEVPEHVAKLNNVTIYRADQKVDTLYLEQEKIFGKQKDIIIGRVGDIAINAEGGLLIADQEKHTIFLFQADGSYITQIGREGKGPGEFDAIGGLKVKSDKLAVYDVLHQRISFFSLDSLSLISEINVPAIDGMMGLGQFYFINDSKLLIGYNDIGKPGDTRYVHFYIFNQQGEKLSDEILKQRIKSTFLIHDNGHTMAGTKPLSRTTLTVISNSGQIYSAWSDNFLIKVYDAQGNYLKSFYYPFQNRPFNRDIFLNQHTGNIMKKIELPETHPALHSMLIDDQDRLWVSTIVADQEVYHWWVLDGTDGHLIARFMWPRDKSIEVVKEGKIYIRETDPETGLQHIVRYDVTME